MNESKSPTPGEASREGLRELDEGHHTHPTTERSPKLHSSGPKFDERPGEAHRGGPLPHEKK